jgi:hypothetical protein
MSNRAAEYRGLIDDVVAGGLLEEDEWQQLKDVVARVERKLLAKQPAQPTEEASHA